VFSRREKTATASPDAATETGKGRATPKRSEAERERRERVRGPSDPKAARRVERQRMQKERRTRQEGLMRGEERYLPKRDVGPRRRFIREWVDGRRTAAELFLPSAVVILLLGLVGSSPAARALSFLIWVALAVSIVVDSSIWTVKLRRELARRFPDDNRRGDIAYAMMRAMLIRQLRTPRPPPRERRSGRS